MQCSSIDKSPHLTTANQVLCGDLSLLFTLLFTRLFEAIARTGGKPLADQFAQQLNYYAEQHGWSALTGLTDLSELKLRTPDVDAKMLSSVYLSYAQHAQALAQQILGEQLLKLTVTSILAGLPPHITQLNIHYGIIRLA
jgi:hypothetical protein